VTDHTGSQSVTFLELNGRYNFDPGILSVPMGPVAFYRMAIHDKVTRFSLTYRDHLAPKTASAEILCGEGKIAIRYTFHDSLEPEAAAKTHPSLAMAPPLFSAPPEASPSQGAGLLSKLAEPAQGDELHGFAACPAAPRGEGAFKRMSSHYDEEGRLVFLAGFEGTLGSPRAASVLDAAIPSSYLELKGSYQASETLHFERSGPLRQARISKSGDVARITFTWREKYPPKKAGLEIWCLEGKLALRYTFERGDQAQLAAKSLALPYSPAAPSSKKSFEARLSGLAGRSPSRSGPNKAATSLAFWD
jgi:predicted secreted Zn-dependent protease